MLGKQLSDKQRNMLARVESPGGFCFRIPELIQETQMQEDGP